ncbi:hypothetical protein B0H14DRAFT_3110179 [Mycena olivaceomarginata]|nr:hypothetical protein B0H14DRAFT_3110179 [Mycena olivaceomarginata]
MDTSPGYPRPNPSHRTTDTLPYKTDVTIISSGLSGLWSGHRDRRPGSVPLLEAREPCDGATARNGGHCRPDCYRDYRDYKADFGQEQALKIIQNEMDTLNLVEEIIAKEGIDCDFWRGFTYDIAMDQPAADSLAASYAEFAADGGPVEGIVTPILDPTQARETTRCQAALAAYNAGGWRVETDRGAVETETVVYATNAYTATLLPEFVGHIWPFKGQCAAAVPPEAYARPNMFRETEQASSDYLIQRPTYGVIIFGGQRRSVPIERLLGNTDDAHIDPQRTEALKKALSRYFARWGEDSGLAGLIAGSQASWGYTAEGIPYVGELHDKPGPSSALDTTGMQGPRMLKNFSPKTPLPFKYAINQLTKPLDTVKTLRLTQGFGLTV